MSWDNPDTAAQVVAPPKIARDRAVWDRFHVLAVRRGVDRSATFEQTQVQVTMAVRAVLLAIALASSAFNRPHVRSLITVVLLGCLLLLSGRLDPRSTTSRLLRFSEAAVVAASVVFAQVSPAPLLPYLLAPAFASGLVSGMEEALVTPAIAAAVMAFGRLVHPVSGTTRDYVTAACEWIALSAAVGLLATWTRRVLTAEPPAQQSYVAANRLLSQLRAVARQLPGGLDTVTLADSLLQSLGTLAPYERAAVFTRSGSERLVPLSYGGTERTDWDIDLSGDNAFADAWASQAPRVSAASRPDGSGGLLVLPLRVGVRGIGLVALTTSQSPSYPPEVLSQLQRVADEVALRLDTALLFDEVRDVATAEERRRLAREIHDGIAQELASLGYAIDSLVAHAVDAGVPELEKDLRLTRQEVSRIVTELRLSIFDLRMEVDRHGGLGAALSDYVRSAGTNSAMTVHLILDESPDRLPAETEAQLLRIAQEAVTNARKHAGARNLWVTCEVHPPHALLRVEDDGSGLSGNRRQDSFGLEVMRERAARLRGDLYIGAREPTGTVVQVCVGVPIVDTVAPGKSA